jgi:UPF0176 protein
MRTISFYRYVRIENPEAMRDRLLKEWADLGVLGRVYLAQEGINAQISVPKAKLESFRNHLQSVAEFTDVPFKFAVVDGESFKKLHIRVRKQIVADGLTPQDYDLANIGKHLTPEEFNQALAQPETVVVDMRNQYESRIGHFRGAVLPDADTFRDELPMVRDLLKGKEQKKVLLYCTGGIRCEKASAYLKHHGFKDVNQLYGGVIQYAHAVKERGIENHFQGKNFVFDERLSERISPDVIAQCDQCGKPSDNQINCGNKMCHVLFIQCGDCAGTLKGCCSQACLEIAQIPEDKQKEIRKGNNHPTARRGIKQHVRLAQNTNGT